MSTMALAFEPDFQSFLNDLHRGPAAVGPMAVGSAGDDRRRSPHPATVPAAAIYRRRRFGALVAIVIGLVALSSLIGATGVLGAIVSPAEASFEPAAAATDTQHTYVVQPGDTLWSIVGGLGVDGDRRVAVHAVAEANGGATLAPGQVLSLDAAFGS